MNNNNNDNNNNDNNNNNNRKNSIPFSTRNEPYFVLVRVIGRYFTFYRMRHDINLARRCWGYNDGNITKIQSFRLTNPLDFSFQNDREIILRLLLSIRDEIPLVAKSADFDSK